MKDKKKLFIRLYVQQSALAVDESDKERRDAIRKFILKQIAIPYGCDNRIEYARVKDRDDILCYILTRSGSTKKSVKNRIERHLHMIEEIWPSLVKSEVFVASVADKD